MFTCRIAMLLVVCRGFQKAARRQPCVIGGGARSLLWEGDEEAVTPPQGQRPPSYPADNSGSRLPGSAGPMLMRSGRPHKRALVCQDLRSPGQRWADHRLSLAVGEACDGCAGVGGEGRKAEGPCPSHGGVATTQSPCHLWGEHLP
ncbi:hypothetical protein HJG60_008960 [Phyllostomus discolor]|uniref:Secreted protein n=1 Tax=Phyllostomus discolor TaxID=89673 RepID=A0A833YWV9_9CHIR|nr:hypothetical protein HJG60_008960 [Phyllostomus discolor]